MAAVWALHATAPEGAKGRLARGPARQLDGPRAPHAPACSAAALPGPAANDDHMADGLEVDVDVVLAEDGVGIVVGGVGHGEGGARPLGGGGGGGGGA